MTNPDSVWQEFAAGHAPGGVVEGTVVEVVPFGAFVEVADGVHGLLHESEAAAPPVGTRLSVRILELDVEQRRMSLRPV